MGSVYESSNIAATCYFVITLTNIYAGRSSVWIAPMGALKQSVSVLRPTQFSPQFFRHTSQLRNYQVLRTAANAPTAAGDKPCIRDTLIAPPLHACVRQPRDWPSNKGGLAGLLHVSGQFKSIKIPRMKFWRRTGFW